MNSPGVYLEIGQNSLRALLGAESLELPLERQENGRLSAACRERVSLSLRAFLKRSGGRSRMRGWCAIGARGVSLRRLSLPAGNKEELQRLLLLQIEGEFPLPPEQLAWGYSQLTEDRTGRAANGDKREVMVAAVKREVVADYEELLSGCGVTPAFTLGALARGAVCPQLAGSWAVLDVGKTYSELMAFQDGAPVSVRLLPWGEGDFVRAIALRLGVGIEEAERIKNAIGASSVGERENADRLASVIEGELNSLARTVGQAWTGQRLYLTGSGAWINELAPGLGRRLGPGVVCERIAVSAGEGWSAAISGLRRAIETNGGHLPLTIHLQGPSGKGMENAPRPRQWRWAAIAGALCVALFALPYVEALLLKGRLERRLAQVKAERGKLAIIDRDFNFLQYLKQNQPPYLEVLQLVSKSAPSGTKIDSLSMNRRGEMTLRATIRGAENVVDFRAKLIKSGMFSTVGVEEQTPQPDRQTFVVRMSAQWQPTTARDKFASAETATGQTNAVAKPGKPSGAEGTNRPPATTNASAPKAKE